MLNHYNPAFYQTYAGLKRTRALRLNLFSKSSRGRCFKSRESYLYLVNRFINFHSSHTKKVAQILSRHWKQQFFSRPLISTAYYLAHYAFRRVLVTLVNIQKYQYDEILLPKSSVAECLLMIVELLSH